MAKQQKYMPAFVSQMRQRLKGVGRLQAYPRLQVGQQVQVQGSVMDAAQALQRPEILAAAAANLGLVASWPSTKREGVACSAAAALPASSNGAAQLGGAHAAMSTAPLALVVGQPYTPISVGGAAGRPGGEGVQQGEPQAVLVRDPSAAGHAPVQQQGWQVWRSLAWGCSCPSRHPCCHPLVGVNLISSVEGFGSEQLLIDSMKA